MKRPGPLQPNSLAPCSPPRAAEQPGPLQPNSPPDHRGPNPSQRPLAPLGPRHRCASMSFLTKCRLAKVDHDWMARPWCLAVHISLVSYLQPQPGDPRGSGETASVEHRCCWGDIDVPLMSFPGGRRRRSVPAAGAGEVGGASGAYGTNRRRAGAGRPCPGSEVGRRVGAAGPVRLAGYSGMAAQPKRSPAKAQPSQRQAQPSHTTARKRRRRERAPRPPATSAERDYQLLVVAICRSWRPVSAGMLTASTR
jgi:hypothetical protein